MSSSLRHYIPLARIREVVARATINGVFACELCHSEIEPIYEEVQDRKRQIHLRQKHRGWELEHTVPLRLGGDDSLDNLRVLCLACHKQVTRPERDLWRNPGKFLRADPLRENRYGVK